MYVVMYKTKYFGGSENWTCGGLVESWEKSNRAISRRENIHGKLSDKMKIQLGEKMCECVSENIERERWQNLGWICCCLGNFTDFQFVCLFVVVVTFFSLTQSLWLTLSLDVPLHYLLLFWIYFRIFPFSGADTETLDLRTPTWCNNFSNKIAFYAVVVAALFPLIFGSLVFFFYH